MSLVTPCVHLLLSACVAKTPSNHFSSTFRSGQEAQGLCFSLHALGTPREGQEMGVHLRTGMMETHQMYGVKAWKAPLSRTERCPWVKLYANGHMWITPWSFLERGYLGRVNFGFCFTFIFKVGYFSSIGDNGLEKPVSHQLTSSLCGVFCPCLFPTCLPSVGWV